MIYKLRQNKEPDVFADIAVIGAGTAGLILAVELAKSGKRVIVVESGEEKPGQQSEALNEVEQTGSYYSGASEGRVRCLGGTSVIWGGAMLPFLRDDIERCDGGWQLAYSDLEPFYAKVEALFLLPEGPYEYPSTTAISPEYHFIPRMAKWPSFKKRNVANVLKKALALQKGLDVWLNSTACEFDFTEDGSLKSLIARNADGGFLKVRAKNFVCAAGAIESTRLLLAMDAQRNENIFTPDAVIGRYFTDHLSSEFARITPLHSNTFRKKFCFRFEGAAMRNLRFESVAASTPECPFLPGFVHVGFNDNLGTFRALREIIRSLQKNSWPNFKDASTVFRNLPWLIKASWWRFVEKRLLPPDGVDFFAHAVIEQEPVYSNRISLSSSVDHLGNPLAKIHWAVSDKDVSSFEVLADKFETFWGKSELGALGNLERLPRIVTSASLRHSGGIYHPCGSTKMGSSANNGVVDKELNSFRVKNLFVLSTAVFPRTGGANPTMTLMALAFRLAKYLKNMK